MHTNMAPTDEGSKLVIFSIVPIHHHSRVPDLGGFLRFRRPIPPEFLSRLMYDASMTRWKI